MAGFRQFYLEPVQSPTSGSIEPVGSVGVVNGQVQSKNYAKGVSGFKIDGDLGDAEFDSGTFRGSVSVGSLDIPDTTTANSFHVDSDGDTWWGATALGSAVAKVEKTGAATFTNVSITGGTITGTPIASIPNDSSTDISLLEKTWTMVFSVTDANTVAWTSGTITLSNARTFSIDAGNTGNMAALTYIYLDTAVSSTVLQTTTTTATAMGANKILIGTAQNNTVTASFIPYGPGQPLVDGANIGALSIVAGNIAASTITAAKMSVSQLSAITADLGAITAGTIVLPSGGYIRSGQTAYDTGTGWYIGNDSSTPKLSIGNSSGDKMTWDGSSLSIVGTINATATVNAPLVKSYTAKGSVTSGHAVYLSNNTFVIDLEAGSSQSLSVTDTAPLSITGDMTMECFVRLESQPGVGGIMTFAAKWAATGNQRSYTFSYQEGGGLYYLGMSVSNNGTATAQGTKANTLTLDTWTHLAFVWTASTSTLEIYVNGSSIGTTTTGSITSIYDSTAPFVIGAQDGVRYFDGMIDEVRVWNDVRTGTEVSNNYQQELIGNEGNIQGYWRLNNSLDDTTSNGATLTNNGSAVFSTNTPFTDIGVSSADASFASTADTFIGFANSTVTDAQTVVVTIAGSKTGLSGLSAGALYYLSNTTGAISTSAGTVTRKVGIAVSTTELLITNIW